MRESDPALEALRLRLARGEITHDEFSRTKTVLEHPPAPAASPQPANTAPTHVPVHVDSAFPKALIVGGTMLAAAVVALFLSFAPWYSVLGVNINPWFVGGYGETAWWLAQAHDTSLQGGDLIRFVGPAVAVGLLLAGGAGAVVLQERKIQLPAVIMATLGLGVYASAAALAIFVAFKNGLDVGAWSFGLWGSVVALLAMLGAGAFFTPEKKPQ